MEFDILKKNLEKSWNFKNLDIMEDHGILKKVEIFKHV